MIKLNYKGKKFMITGDYAVFTVDNEDDRMVIIQGGVVYYIKFSFHEDEQPDFLNKNHFGLDLDDCIWERSMIEKIESVKNDDKTLQNINDFLDK